MDQIYIAVRLYLCFAMAISMVSAQVQGIVGRTMNITCSVSGTLPRWTKDTTIPITIEGNPTISPDYRARFSYAADQKTLEVSLVQDTDAGRYVCSIGGVQGTTDVVVSISTILIIIVICCKIIKAVCAFFVLVILVHTVVIIKCSHILIGEHKRQKENKKNGKPKDNDGQNKLVWVIIITAAVIFIAVSVWFIVMQATVEDCKEMKKSKCNVHIGLLAFEVVGFVLGVVFVIYLFYNYRGSTNDSNPDDPRNLDHLNYSTSTKKVQEPNQKATFI